MMAGTTHYRSGRGTDRGCPNGSPHRFYAAQCRRYLCTSTLICYESRRNPGLLSSPMDKIDAASSLVRSLIRRRPWPGSDWKVWGASPIKDPADIPHICHLSWPNRLGWLLHFCHRRSVFWTQTATATEDVAEVRCGAVTVADHLLEERSHVFLISRFLKLCTQHRSE